MDIDFDKFGLDILINTAAIIKRNLREEKIDKLLLWVLSKDMVLLQA